MRTEEMVYITLVCGFPRSGTSLMMNMLRAGGLPIFYDVGKEISWETDLIFTLPREHRWLNGCYGKAVKLLEPLSIEPPNGYRYRAIWLNRDIRQQVKSNLKFAKWAGVELPAGYSKELRKQFQADRGPTLNMLRQKAEGRCLILDFEYLLGEPLKAAREVQEFLNRRLDIGAMASVVIQRPTSCLPFMLEEQLLGGVEVL